MQTHKVSLSCKKKKSRGQLWQPHYKSLGTQMLSRVWALSMWFKVAAGAPVVYQERDKLGRHTLFLLEYFCDTMLTISTYIQLART